MGLLSWERKISMGNMSLNKSSIFLLPKHESYERVCWGCEEEVKVYFRDASTGGHLCRECMPDVYWAEKVLTETEGIRAPRPGEIGNQENN